MSDLRPGQILDGTYKVHRMIAEGGMGVVYEATHLRTHRRVALKILHADLAKREDILERFKREARICGELGHPNIVGVLDFNRTPEGLTYLSEEFLEGMDLARRLRQDGRIGIREVCEITTQVSEALAAAHAHGVVHRDLKPQNIYLVDGRRTQAKVLDFGISKIRGSGRELTQHSAVVGTPQYMAPEQARGEGDEVGSATDQFALGVMVYEMLTGRSPFESSNTPQALYRIVHEEVEPPSKLEGSLAERVDLVILRALHKDPANRFPDVLSFAHALAEAAGFEPTSISAPPLTPVSRVGQDSNAAGQASTSPSPAGGGRSGSNALPSTAGGNDTVYSPVGSGSSASATDMALSPTIAAAPTGSPRPTTLSAGTGEVTRHRQVVRIARVKQLAIMGLVVFATTFSVAWALSFFYAPEKREAANLTRAAAPPITPAAAEVVVIVHVEPDTASVSVDGVEMLGRLFRFKKDGKPHFIRVEATDYRPIEERFVAHTDREFTFKLERLPGARSVAVTTDDAKRQLTGAKKPTKKRSKKKRPKKKSSKGWELID